MQTVDGRLYVIAGASRSGKTAWTKRQTAKARRVFAWDPEAQWCELRGWKKITTKAALAAAIQKPGPQKLAFVAGGDLKEAFGFFAQCCMYAARHVEPGLDVIAEELADVTTPSKAPGNWGILLQRGLKRGVTLWCISQRWSEADKTAMGNASDFVVFRQARGADAVYLSKNVGLPLDKVDSLKPLQYVHKNGLTGEIFEGRLKF